jgi:translation initiation factor 2 alpha subunit (eIF-2alpha)
VDVTNALDQMRRKLEASFGKAMAMMILAAASNSANVSTVAVSAEEFRRLVEVVSRDQRVIDMWGAAGAADAAAQWSGLA